jgi:hypothetical protein
MTQTKTIRNWYAIHCPYGLNALNTDGIQADRAHRFPSRKLRDEFVSRDQGRREAVKAAHPIVRKVKRLMATHGAPREAVFPEK